MRLSDRRRSLLMLLALGALLGVPTGATAETLVGFGAPGWRIQAATPGAVPGFASTTFDDSAWAIGTAPFGALTICPVGPTLPAPTTSGGWANGGDLLLRRTVTVPSASGFGTIELRIDNDADVYLNGALLRRVHHDGCANVLPPAAIHFTAAKLRTGANVLAVRAHDELDQRYVDVKMDVANTVPCRTSPCTATAMLGGARATVTAPFTGAGESIFLAFDRPDQVLDCDRYTEYASRSVTVDATPDVGDKEVAYRYPIPAGEGAKEMRVCFAAPYSFDVRPGYKATSFLYDGDGDGVRETWFAGVLPDCRVPPPNNGPACQLGASLVAPRIVELRAIVPGGGTDPRMKG
jgi:hypothetical protein